MRLIEGGQRAEGPAGAWVLGERRLSAEAPARSGLAPGARVQSDRGLLPVEALAPGDRLPDGLGGTVTVRAIISIAPEGGAVRVAAGALGQGRPVRDVVLGTAQRVCVEDPLLRGLCGTDAALVAARDLLALPGVDPAASGEATVHVVLDEAGTFVADGLTVAGFDGLTAELPSEAAEELFLAVPQLRYAGGRARYADTLPRLDAREVRAIFGADSTSAEGRGIVGAERAVEEKSPCIAPGTSVSSRPSPASWRSPPLRIIS